MEEINWEVVWDAMEEWLAQEMTEGHNPTALEKKQMVQMIVEKQLRRKSQATAGKALDKGEVLSFLRDRIDPSLSVSIDYVVDIICREFAPSSNLVKALEYAISHMAASGIDRRVIQPLREVYAIHRKETGSR